MQAVCQFARGHLGWGRDELPQVIVKKQVTNIWRSKIQSSDRQWRHPLKAWESAKMAASSSELLWSIDSYFPCVGSVPRRDLLVRSAELRLMIYPDTTVATSTSLRAVATNVTFVCLLPDLTSVTRPDQRESTVSTLVAGGIRACGLGQFFADLPHGLEVSSWNVEG